MKADRSESMTDADLRKCDVLLSLQRALLGEVSPNLRAVTVHFTDASIHFEAFYDGEPHEEDRESMLLVETEVMAEFPSSHAVTHAVSRLDAPALIPKDSIWAYYRREPLL